MPEQLLQVAGIGELLWDVFPNGKRLGGAPLNFCYHCQQLGTGSFPVSAVGADPLGDQIREELDSRSISDNFVSTARDLNTGTVQVRLDQKGVPSYEICQGVAWDAIAFGNFEQDLAGFVDAVCFGSLAQRNPKSRRSIEFFVSSVEPEAICVFDVNLRQDFYDRSTLERSLQISNVLKVSDEELPVLASLFGLRGSHETQLQTLLEHFGLDLIAYTRGGSGSVLATETEIDEHPGYAIEPVNTVGAGDSFTATLIVGLLKGKSLQEVNDHANQVAAFVCSQEGATPELPESLRSVSDPNFPAHRRIR